MRIQLVLATAILILSSVCFAEDAGKMVTGTVDKVDADAKTVAVKTEDGTEKVAKFTEDTTVYGAHDVEKGTKAAADALADARKKGVHVVVYYTKKGSEDAGKKVAHAFHFRGGLGWALSGGMCHGLSVISRRTV